MTHDYHYPTLDAGLAANCARCAQIVANAETIDDAFAAPLNAAELREALSMYRQLKLSGIWTEQEAHDAGRRLLDRNTLRRANA